MAPWWMRPTADGEDEASKNEAPDLQETTEVSSLQDRDNSPPSRRSPRREASRANEPADDPGSDDTPAEGSRVDDRGAEDRGAEDRGEQDRGAVDGSQEEQPSSSRPRRRRRRRSSASRAAPDEDYTFDDSSFPIDEEEDDDNNQPEPEPTLEAILRELFLQAPEKVNSDVEEHKIAMFCDFENIALGVRDSESKKFEISLVLERLREKGKVIVKKAYSDWSRYAEYKKTFHEAGIELIEIPQKYYSGKNSADIKMVVDAMDLCYSNEHIDTYVVMSGDSDFSPLVSKLKENNKTVIGVGVKNASSVLLIDNCDEFIYYEDLWRDAETAPLLDGLSNKDSEAFGLLNEAILALVREDKDVLWGSMIKQTIKRKRPSFNEGYFGYRTFSELLEDAEHKNIIRLKKDRRSGSYIVTGFANAR